MFGISSRRLGKGFYKLFGANTEGTKPLNIMGLSNANIEVCRVTAPLPPKATWEIESLLLKIFEYGDYSIRSTLQGEYSKTLDCTFFLARYKEKLAGVAGCLCGRKNPAIAVLGPVGVTAEYRGNGIGTKLVTSLIDYLKLKGCMAVYLGLSTSATTATLYEKLGFEKYKGIVMRLLMCPEAQFEERYFGKCADVEIRRVAWGDFPGIQGLLTYPCSMYTVDLRRSIFSSKYVKLTKFLTHDLSLPPR